MAGPPEEFTVEQMVSSGEVWGDNNDKRTDEVLFEGDGRTWKIYNDAANQAPAAGSVLKGWKNHDKGTFGIAKDKAPGARSTSHTGSSNGRRDDATGQSIERQTAAKAAAEMAAAIGGTGPIVLANFEEFFEGVHAKITGKPGQHVHRDEDVTP